MKQLDNNTAKLIDDELRGIPAKYQKNFNSTHEGYAVLLEEVRELEHVVFFGEKEAKDESLHRKRLKEEAIQIAAMAVRIIQELC